MSEPTPRQILYALVAGGFILVVVVLTIGAVNLVPVWWTIVMSVVVASAALYTALRWRQTAVVLSIAITVFLVWAVGTLLVV